MLTAEENERLTRVGRGTPAGEMLRRYWWPVGFMQSIGLGDRQKVRLRALRRRTGRRPFRPAAGERADVDPSSWTWTWNYPEQAKEYIPTVSVACVQ